MKGKDIATVILIAIISMVTSYYLLSLLAGGDPGDKVEEVKTMKEISSDVVLPSDRIFNREAINPTVYFDIGKDNGNKNQENNQGN